MSTIHYKKPGQLKTLIQKSVSKTDDGLVTVNATFLVTQDTSLIGYQLDNIPGASPIRVASEALEKQNGLTYLRVTGYGAQNGNLNVAVTKNVRSFSSELTREVTKNGETTTEVVTFSFDYLAQTVVAQTFVPVNDMWQSVNTVGYPEGVGPQPTVLKVFNRRGTGVISSNTSIVGGFTLDSWSPAYKNTIVAQPIVLIGQSIEQVSRFMARVTVTKQFLYT